MKKTRSHTTKFFLWQFFSCPCYFDLDNNLRSLSSFNFLSLSLIFKFKQNYFFNDYFFIMFLKNERQCQCQCSPTLKIQGSPTPTHVIKKLYLRNFEYKILNKHVEYSDQHMGAVHPGLSNIDFQVMKICTITLIGMTSLALKVLAMFTLSMGTMIFESVTVLCWSPLG